MRAIEIVGQNIKRLRAGQTQAELATRAGVSRVTVLNLERCANKGVKLESVNLIADALEVETWELCKPHG